MTLARVVSPTVANNPPFTPIVLVHGLYETTWYMKLLARRLAQAGYETHLFRYYSLVQTMSRHSERLQAFLTEKNLTEAHFIGHSLGGLVIRQFLYDNAKCGTPIKIGRIVTLGTPHLGSTVANYAQRLAHPMIKNAFRQGLDGHCPPLIDGVCLGVIAGTKAQGLGMPVLTYHKYRPTRHTKPPQNTPNDTLANDGTVYVFETKLPNAADHITLAVSHTGMLFDKEVLKQSLHFLEHAKFLK